MGKLLFTLLLKPDWLTFVSCTNQWRLSPPKGGGGGDLLYKSPKAPFQEEWPLPGHGPTESLLGRFVRPPDGCRRQPLLDSTVWTSLPCRLGCYQLSPLSPFGWTRLMLKHAPDTSRVSYSLTHAAHYECA